MKYLKSIIPKALRNNLYKKKRKVLNYVNSFLLKSFWENNVDNLYYGHYDIFKRYADIILPYKINGELQHGWSPNSGIASFPISNDNQGKNSRYYLFNDANKEKCTKMGFKNTVAIGSPFLYLPKIKEKKNYLPKSLILFPYHSTEYDKDNSLNIGYKNYLKSILRISSKFKSITACLYWKDYENQGIIDQFHKKKIKTISLGHRDNNPNFLFNFVNLVNDYEYVSSDYFSSAVFYSLKLRRKVFIYGEPISFHYKSKVSIDFEKKLSSKEAYEIYSKRYPELLWENFNNKTQIKIAEIELGQKFKKSPEQIRSLFEWNLKSILREIVRNFLINK